MKERKGSESSTKQDKPVETAPESNDKQATNVAYLKNVLLGFSNTRNNEINYYLC